jgi:hypothetical protein
MADLDKRVRMAAESILENEALRGGLENEQAAMFLLNWGIACAKSLMLETADIEDDEEADEAVYPRMKALRKMMVAVKELAGSQAQDVSAWQHSIAEIFKNAQTFYGPSWHAPDQIGDEIWLILQTGDSLERVQGLQALLEPSGFSDGAESSSYAPPQSEPEPAPEETDSKESISFSTTGQDAGSEYEQHFLETDPDITEEQDIQNITDKKDKGDDDVTFNKQTPI